MILQNQENLLNLPMFLIHQPTGEKREAVIEPIVNLDYKLIKKSKRFPAFDWNKEKSFEVFKLRLKDSEAILGLTSLIDYKDERWIKINLLQSSIENVGDEKEYKNIAGCLIAYACSLAFIRGYGGCVALHPKTELALHYIQVYGFEMAGMHLFTDLKNSKNLIKKYLP
jgi:hypothetical protein